MLFGVCVSCCIMYSIVSYLYVSCSRSITSIGEERAYLPAIVYLLLCGFGEVSSLSWCLGWAALFYCCAAWALPYNYWGGGGGVRSSV